ncbi:SRPBCC family protein [uncultured Aquimarina sp.]|uniref:SRPBCC family protein n=1 Tax=uncultured Aquimarina sp. TaxID=575652 RepID=UPI0026171186|nr:SRPBCC family protein [uncultured Aquimarina sp.]
MKTLKLLSLVALFVFGVSTNKAIAQNPDAKLTHTKIVDKGADDVWKIVRNLDFAKYTKIVSNVVVTGEAGAGASRVCSTADGKGQFKENILSYDDLNRTYTYAVIEGVPVKGLVNNFKVVDLGYNKSMIVWWSNYEQFMKNPQMTEAQFSAFMQASIDEIVTNMANDA